MPTGVIDFGENWACETTLQGEPVENYEATTSAEACAAAIASDALRTSEALPAYRAWHTLSWNSTERPSLTAEEREAWDKLGVKEGNWTGPEATEEEQDGRGSAEVGPRQAEQQWTTYKDFSKSIFLDSNAPHWRELDKAQRQAAAQLAYTEDTWGRTGLLEARTVHGDRTLLEWADLSVQEQQVLGSAGWDAEKWASGAWAGKNCDRSSMGGIMAGKVTNGRRRRRIQQTGASSGTS